MKLPPFYTELHCYAPALGKPEKMDSIWRPRTVLYQVIEDFREEFQSRGGIGSVDELSEVVKGGVPLKRLLVKERNSV